jgi:hypothetical protein
MFIAKTKANHFELLETHKAGKYWLPYIGTKPSEYLDLLP